METYENFPPRQVAATLLVTASIYAVGAAILAGFGTALAGVYLLFCLGNELQIMKKSCTDCFYFGRWCAFGRGKAAALLFKRGEPRHFHAKHITWKDLLPDMLVVVFPLVAGSVLLLQAFSWTTLVLLAVFAALSFGGTYLIRSRIACAGCRQRELGCPAEQFFSRRLA